jgi:hypothetical protein
VTRPRRPTGPLVRALALAGDLGAAVAPGGDVAASLRPFLALRILGVIPLGQMNGSNAAACLAKLAELTSSTLNLPDWCATTAICAPKQAVPWLRTRQPVCGRDSKPVKEHHDRSCPRPADHPRR